MTDPRVLEPIAARGWPAAESAELGGWRLHASAGQSGRINTCWPLDAPDRAIDEAIAAAEAWYARARLRAALQDRRGLSQRAATSPSGWRRAATRPDTPTLTMVGPLDGRARSGRAHRGRSPARLSARVRRSGVRRTTPTPRERLEALARIPTPRGFALIRMDGAPAAVGACAVDGEWAGDHGHAHGARHSAAGAWRARIFRTLTAFAATAGAPPRLSAGRRGQRLGHRPLRGRGLRSRSYLYRYWVRRRRTG